MYCEGAPAYVNLQVFLGVPDRIVDGILFIPPNLLYLVKRRCDLLLANRLESWDVVFLDDIKIGLY